MKADKSKQMIRIGALCGVFIILIVGSIIWEENTTFSDKPSNTLPVMIRGDELLYIQDGASGYTIIDIENNRISFSPEGRIETVTSEWNAYPSENDQTNFEGLVGCEYGHIDGKLLLLYKNQLIKYTEQHELRRNHY